MIGLEMAGSSKRRLKAAKQAKRAAERIHDRRVEQLPINAMVRPITVDDPYEPGGKITTVQSLRDDPLARLHVRSQIDDAQYAAGRHWQNLYEAAEIGGVRAMDTTKEPVDGGGFLTEPITDRQRDAARELGRLSRSLGQDGDALVRSVLGHRWFIEQIAAARGIESRRGIEYLGRRFRECLETLARELGYA